ncbi:MAG TPA: hypothetical protein DEA50_05700, partial [Parvularcula sp.]|nr:hypothetical protein [Parvularcula sp.]
MSNGMTPSAGKGAGADVLLISLALALMALWSVFTAARTVDSLMAAHAMMFFAASVIGAFALVSHVTSQQRADAGRYEMGVVKAGVFASVFWGVAGFLV